MIAEPQQSKAQQNRVHIYWDILYKQDIVVEHNFFSVECYIFGISLSLLTCNKIAIKCMQVAYHDIFWIWK